MNGHPSGNLEGAFVFACLEIGHWTFTQQFTKYFQSWKSLATRSAVAFTRTGGDSIRVIRFGFVHSNQLGLQTKLPEVSIGLL